MDSKCETNKVDTDDQSNMADCPDEIKAFSKDMKSGIFIKQPKRRIVIEPVLIMMAFCFVPMMQVSQLFIYGKMEDYVAKKTGFNNTSPKSNESNKGNCVINTSSLEYQFTQEVQKYNSYFGMVSNLISFLPEIFAILFLTAYSDKAGRRYAILIPLIGNLIRSCCFLIVYKLNLPVWGLWIGEFGYGCTGGSALLFAGCFSYLADITTKENRQFRITVAEMVMFFASIMGPIGIGYLIKENGYLWPLVVANAGYFINIIYTFFFVPETLTQTGRVKFFTFEHFKHSANVLTRDTPDKRRWKLWFLFISFLIHYIGAGVYFVTNLFVLNIPLCWGAVTIGYFNTSIIAVSTVGGIALAKLMKYYTSDAVIAVTSAFVDTANLIYKGFVSNTIMMFISIIFAPFWNLLTPTTRAMMSTLVEEDEQGSVFGAIAIVELVAQLIGSESMTYIYSETLDISPGFVFFIGAIFYFTTGCMFIFYIIKSRREQLAYRQLETME